MLRFLFRVILTPVANVFCLFLCPLMALAAQQLVPVVVAVYAAPNGIHAVALMPFVVPAVRPLTATAVSWRRVARFGLPYCHRSADSNSARA